jgi:uncharacterized protein YodC (DUF2158 family)
MTEEPIETLPSNPQLPSLRVPPKPLKVGDVVVLRSGSQELCVTDVHPDKTVRCAWFDAQKKKVTRVTFPQAALRLAHPEKTVEELVAFADLIYAAARATGQIIARKQKVTDDRAKKAAGESGRAPHLAQ